jgi:UDP-glucose 4-epimerase
MFHALYRTPVPIARLFMTSGPGQDMRELISYVTLFLLQHEAQKLSRGRCRADLIYIDDVVDGLLRAAEVDDTLGCAIDLELGTLVPIQTIVHQLIKPIDSQAKPLFGALPDRPLEQIRIEDTTYICSKLYWKPNMSLENIFK